MTHDILPLIPPVLPLVALDSLLRTLTHTSPLRRRGALLLLVVAYFLGIRLLLSVRTSLNPPRIPLPSLWEREDDLARAYVPAPATAEQTAAYSHLVRMIEERRSAYPASVFREKALSSETSPVVGVTAVVLHWKRRKGLELVLRHITRYPFIREVIVWNNRPGVELKPDDFRFAPPPGSDLPPAVLRIVNSPSNVHDAGKHLACSMASFEHCYFNDDDWLNIYMDATYTKYLECCSGRRSPAALAGIAGRIASNTMPIIHLEHRRWRFDNPDIDLHTGFTWLGTGSFSPRHFSSRFMQQQSATPIPLDRDQSLVADMFFSLWTNSYPEQMPNDLVPIDVEGGEVGWSRGDGVDQWKVVYGNIRTAVQTLHHILTLSSPALSPHPFPLSPPPPESLTRAPCANDGCLFVTSMSPFPDPSSLRASYAISPAGKLEGERKGLFGSLFRRGQHGGGRHSNVAGGLNAAPATRLDPSARGWTVQEHEARFNALQRPKLPPPGPKLDLVAAGGALRGGAGRGPVKEEWETAWPGDEWWIRNGSWHLAVDGKGQETCWESFRPPDADDHFGLTLVKPRAVRQLTIIGSLDLGNMVNWEDVGAGSESWEVLTVRADGSGGWEPRFLLGPPKVVRLPGQGSLISVTLSLEPIRTPTTYALRQEGNYEVDEDGREVAVRKIKFVSRGRKREPVRVCAWDLDGWKI
ncbi:hypothetical protein JCM11251_005897 [Rhodosporidiobolus azoricus]